MKHRWNARKLRRGEAGQYDHQLMFAVRAMCTARSRTVGDDSRHEDMPGHRNVQAICHIEDMDGH